MANDLATLRTKLATALRDPTFAVWESAELDDLLTWACASLYPRVAIAMSIPIWPVTSDEEDFDLPLGMMEVSRVDLAQVSDDTLIMPLPGGTWEINGDPWSSTGKLFINRGYADPDRYYIVHGYGLYNLSTGLPPDTYIPYILAKARAEAWRRMLGSRARYVQWAKLNQKENVSLNELSGMLNQAESEAERELSRMKTWRKPKPAR